MTPFGSVDAMPKVSSSPFLRAFVLGLASPTMLYAAPVSYMMVIRDVSPGCSFGIVGGLMTNTLRKARSDEKTAKSIKATA